MAKAAAAKGVVDQEQRPGEVRLPLPPIAQSPDAGLVFIGQIRSPWKTLQDCPKNPRQARQRGGDAFVEIDAAYWQGLTGLQVNSPAALLYWMHQARRDLIVLHPGHKDKPTGTFALRSPIRPNPISLTMVRILKIDQTNGRLKINAIDCVDGTPLLDIKPWLESIDVPLK